MRTGLSQSIGAQYQDYVGVLRVLDMLVDDNLVSIEFQRINEEAEDIIVSYENHTLYDQTKKNEQGHWTPSDMIGVIKHFYDTWRKLGFQNNVRFRFTTNAPPNTEMRRIDRMFAAVRRESNQIDSGLMKRVKQMLAADITDSELSDLAKHTEFAWNVGAIRDVDNPVTGIKETCQMELSKKTALDMNTAKDIVDQLVIEVMNKTQDRGESRAFTRAILEGILPGYVSIRNKIKSLPIPSSILAEILDLDPTYCAISKLVMDNGENYNAPALLKFGKKLFVVWIITQYTIQEEIELIDRVINSAKDLKHIIISDGSINHQAFGKRAKQCIVGLENPKRVIEIVRVSSHE